MRTNKAYSWAILLFLIAALSLLGCGKQTNPVDVFDINASANPILNLSKPTLPFITDGELDGEVVLQLIAGNPDGECCPAGFDIIGAGTSEVDRNGDRAICRKFNPIDEATIFIDNNVPRGLGAGPCKGF